MSALETLKTFDINSLPDLDVVVTGALELFIESPLPTEFPGYKKPLVVGSVGAFVAGKIVFANTNAVFADESTYHQVLDSNPDIDGAILISASGSKHAIEIGKELQDRGLDAILLTNNPEAPAKEFFPEGKVLVFPKNREPYTNNTSTYLGMILAKSGESPRAIKDFIATSVNPALTTDFSQYEAFTFILPSSVSAVTSLVRIKFEEMFEPIINGRAYAFEEIKHAKTVVVSEKELMISLGVPNDHYGLPEHRLQIPFPENGGAGAAMAICYYIVGKIQAAHPPYFKENISAYAERASAIFGYTINPIVE